MRRSGSAGRWLVVAASVLALVAGGVTPAAAAPVASASTAQVMGVERYVVEVYRDLFGRHPDPQGLAGWRDAILAGRPRVEVANAITSSVEYRSRLVTGTYERFLGRGPDPEGLRNWVAAMAAGWTVAQIGAGFISSDEYYHRAGATRAGWVQRLYADVLGRAAAPSEVDVWVRELARGAGRSQVAMGFLLSGEHLSTVVDGYYVTLLGRHLDPTGQQTWVSALQRGVRDEDIIGGIIASGEYWGTTVGPLPTRIILEDQAPVTAGQPVTFSVAAFDDQLSVAVSDVSAESQVSVHGSATPCVRSTCTVTQAGTYTVQATWHEFTTFGQVTVVPGAVASITLTPPVASVSNGASVVYTVAGRDAYGNATDPGAARTVLAVDGDPAACVAARCRPVGAGPHQVTASLTDTAGVTASATIQVAAPGPTRFRAFEWGEVEGWSTGGPDGAVLGSTAQWASVSVGSAHALATKSDGSLWSWGSNGSGQLGHVASVRHDVPEPVGTRSDWVSVAAGSEVSFAITADGSLWGWGRDLQNPGRSQTSPKRIGTDTDWAAVSAGGYFVLATKRDGSLWAWGENDSGQLGDGTTTTRTAPTRVGTGTWSSVDAGYDHAIGVMSDGSLWFWGMKYAGFLGHVPPVTVATPTRVGAESDWRSVAAGFWVSAAIRTDGSLWTWGGFASTGQLGDGTRDFRLDDPVQVGVGTTWASVAFGGYHTVALDSSGGLWRWGRPEWSQSKDDDVLLPQRVGAETGWTSAAAGYGYTIALRP